MSLAFRSNSKSFASLTTISNRWKTPSCAGGSSARRPIGRNDLNRPRVPTRRIKWNRNLRKAGFLATEETIGGFLAGRLLRSTPDSNYLIRVAQRASLIAGRSAVCRLGREVLAHAFPTPPLQRFLSGGPAIPQTRGATCPNLLIVTTNHNDLMEQAFEERSGTSVREQAPGP
jgi:hypothetical protein